VLWYARRLRGIEDGLTASEPGLAAKYAIFNELAAADGPARTETLRGPSLIRRAADSGGMAARVAAAIVLLSVVVSGLVIGALLQPAVRSCPAASQSAASQAISEAAASAVMPAMPVPGAAGRCGTYVGR
jgi:hypothetical protein